MTYSSASRYAQGETLWVNTTSRGNKQTVYLNMVGFLTNPYAVKLVRESDDMEQVAYRAYRDCRMWWEIADANPQVFYPLDLIPGDQLRVPQ